LSTPNIFKQTIPTDFKPILDHIRSENGIILNSLCQSNKPCDDKTLMYRYIRFIQIKTYITNGSTDDALDLCRRIFSESNYSKLYKLRIKKHLLNAEIDSLRENNTIYLLEHEILNKPKRKHIYEIISLAELHLFDIIRYAIKKDAEKWKETAREELLTIKRLYGDKYNARGNKVSTAIDEALKMLPDITQDFPNTLLSRIPMGSHIAHEFSNDAGRGFLHHAVYIGRNKVIDVLYHNEHGTLVGTADLRFLGTVSDELTQQSLFTAAKRQSSKIYLITYDNPYSHDTIINRAYFGLGTSEYKINNQNCETFVNWVFTNQFETLQSIIKRNTVTPRYSTNNRNFRRILSQRRRKTRRIVS